MAPLNTTTTEPSPSATAGSSDSTVLDTQKRSHFEGRTIIGIIFALSCFAIITCVFLSSKRGRYALHDSSWPWLGKLKRLVPCLRPPIQPDTTQENEGNNLSRQPTFPPLVSRASTFDQRLPVYSQHDPAGGPMGHQDTRCPPIGEVSAESLRSVTPN